MGTDGAKLLAITILVSLLVGVGVLVFKKDYTFQQNIKSNEPYCPTIDAEWDGTPTTNAAPARDDRARGRRAPQNTADALPAD